mgnify:CR=1 FL=1
MNRLAKPISHDDSQSEFLIKPEGESLLMQDVFLICGAAGATPAAGARYKDIGGGWSLIRELRIVDTQGRTLTQVKEANRLAAMYVNLRERPSYALAVENELSCVRSSLQAISTGKFEKLNTDQVAITDSTATTAKVALNLRRLVDLLDRKMLPLWRLGEVRLIIRWETLAARIFTDVTGAVTIARPELAYTLLLAPELTGRFQQEFELGFVEPELSTNAIAAITAGTANYSIPLGFQGAPLQKLLITLTRTDEVDSFYSRQIYQSMFNAVINGQKLYPQDLLGGAQHCEFDRAFGPLGLPAGGWYKLDEDTLAGQGISDQFAYRGFDLRVVPTSDFDFANATFVDHSGVTLNFQRTYLAGAGGPNTNNPMTFYVWGFRNRVIKVGASGVKEVI